MKSMLLYPIGSTAALRFAVNFLHNEGIPLVDHPTPEVTHLLLDVPSFSPDGTLRGGGTVGKILSMLPPITIVIGGNLDHPDLSEHQTVDLLHDETYLSMNAAITADCALQVAAKELQTTFRETPTLIIGCGRIGRCLAQMLKSLGSEVTVATRNESHRSALLSLGYHTVDMDTTLTPYRLIFNTAPEPVFTQAITNCRNCVKIDLASRKGLAGDDVLWARGLPGIYAPESSGRLIADTFLRICKEVQS